MVSVYPDMAPLPPQVTVTLHGHLRQWAAPCTLHAAVPVAAINGVITQYPALEKILRQGRYLLRAGGVKRGRDLSARDMLKPIGAKSLHVLPFVGGSARGQGKAVLGLTMLGLSMVPGANAAIGSSFGQLGQRIGAGDAFQAFGNQLLGRAGSLILLAGAAEALAPQSSRPAGQMPSSAVATPETRGQGAPIPLIYGNARLEDPVVVSSGLDIVTRSETT